MTTNVHTLGIVSPSSPISNEADREWRLARLETAEANLSTRGIQTVRGSHILECTGFEAGSTAMRLRDLHAFYSNDAVSAIIATRGGRACSSLIDELNFDLINESGKPLVGFSDLTLLLNGIYAKTGMIGVHGPMVVAGLQSDDSLMWKSFTAALSAEEQIFPMTEFGEWWRAGEAEGTLLGGNLVTLECLLGTPYEPEWDGAILFWEEIGEPISKIWRSLYHFANAGVFGRIGGMIIGHLGGVTGGTVEEEVLANDFRDTIMSVVQAYDFPVVKSMLFGHGVETQLSLPVGGHSTLSSNTISFRF